MQGRIFIMRLMLLGILYAIIYFMFIQFLFAIFKLVYNMTMLLLNIKILFDQWSLVTHETTW